VVLLEEARARGDALIVGLNTDESIRRLKGPTRPAQPLQDRARVLAALHAVDAVVPFAEDTPLNLVLALKPDVLVKGGDYQVSTIVGAKEVMGWGGEVAVISLLPDRSTTALLQRNG
jgi:D-beta-D-heptose 7-phosphate kinase/D-beta-D-heptose 1-phosphate adenosyltransferase